jgi:hypothetical protein
MFGTDINKVAQNFNGMQVTRIRIGNYRTLEEAKKHYHQLNKFCKNHGLDPFIARQY